MRKALAVSELFEHEACSCGLCPAPSSCYQIAEPMKSNQLINHKFPLDIVSRSSALIVDLIESHALNIIYHHINYCELVLTTARDNKVAEMYELVTHCCRVKIFHFWQWYIKEIMSNNLQERLESLRINNIIDYINSCK